MGLIFAKGDVPGEGLAKSNFTIEIAGIGEQKVKTVSEIKELHDVGEEWEGASAEPIHILGSRNPTEAITITRVKTDDKTWYDWNEMHKKRKEGHGYSQAELEKDIFIRRCSVNGQVVIEILLERCALTEYSHGDFDASTGDAAMENIVVKPKNVKRKK